VALNIARRLSFPEVQVVADVPAEGPVPPPIRDVIPEARAYAEHGCLRIGGLGGGTMISSSTRASLEENRKRTLTSLQSSGQI